VGFVLEQKPSETVAASNLFPYMMDRIDLNRAIENICAVIKHAHTLLIILDHHLLRDGIYRARLSEVYELASKTGKRVITAAEYLGETSVIDKALRWKEHPDEAEPLVELARSVLPTNFSERE